MSAFNWPVSHSPHLLPGKYLPANLRRLSQALGCEVRIAFAGGTYLASTAPIEGEADMRADYVQYQVDRLLALMRTMADDQRSASLAQQFQRLRETDLGNEEVELIGHLVAARLPALDPAPLDEHASHMLADHLEVRGAVLRGRVRDFFGRAITLGALRPWAEPR
ncbi:hypothetical protein D9M68_358950 [compost metagenome]